MHLRYDLKNKLDLVNFEKQSSFFLNKEDCVFSFYLSDFAISFNVIKNESDFKVETSISELGKENKNGDVFYKSVVPCIDPRFSELDLFNEIFPQGSSQGVFNKNCKQDVLDAIVFIVKLMHKINKLASLA